MKLKHLFLLTFLLISLTSLAADGDTFTSLTPEGVEMTFQVVSEESHTCQVGKGTSEASISDQYEGVLTIPSSAEGYTVVSISNFAFLDCSGISELTLPETVTMVANYSFLGVGSESAPCLLFVPDGYDLGVDTSGSFFRWKGGIFHIIHKPYACLSTDGTMLTFLCDGNESTQEGTIYRLNEGNNRPDWYDAQSPIRQVVFDPSFAEASPTSTKSWFEGMGVLTNIIGLQYLNTSKVTQMNSMFNGCFSLTDIDLQYFDTSSTTLMGSMFLDCISLSQLDLSNFDCSNVTNMTRMFSGCENLTELTLGPTFSADNLGKANYLFSNCKSLHNLDLTALVLNETTTTVEMLSGCSSLDTLTINPTMGVISSDACLGVGSTENPCLLFAPEGLEVAYLDGEIFLWKSGMFRFPKAKAYVTANDSVMTFRFDNHYHEAQIESTTRVYFFSEDNSERSWSFDNSSDTIPTLRVVFTPSFSQYHPTTTASWFELDFDKQSFQAAAKLVFEGMENLNTSEVTDMSRMFYGCQEAEGLDISSFDTSNVTDMSMMFAYCTTVTHLDLDNFDTSNVTDMSNMFRCCSELKSLNLSNFDTSETTSMAGMFYGCINLEEIDLSGFNTSQVTNMSDFFAHCHSLESMDIIHFDTSNVTDMSGMFACCKKLIDINISEFDTQNVTSMEAMFLRCEKLQEINLNSFDTSNVTDMSGMFAGCSMLTTLDLFALNFTEVNKYDSPEIDRWEEFADTPDDMYLGFLSGCHALRTLYIPQSIHDLTDRSCEGVGTEESPCLIYAPEDFDFETDTNSHSFFWKGGYFTLDNTPDPEEVSLSVDLGLLMAGDRIPMNINLFNGEEVFNGFQFEIHLPDGISLAKEDNDFAYELSDRFSKKGMNITIRDYGNGKYRLIAFSLSNITIQGSQGNIITLYLQADPNLLSGEYLGSLGNIIFSHLDGYSMDLDNVEFTIPVSTFALGDVNHDTYINVTDIMLVVNRILDNYSLSYHEENADMNQDGRIDVTDVMQIVNLILLNDSPYSPRHDHAGDRLVLSSTAGGCDLNLTSSDDYTACQMMVKMPEGATLTNAYVDGSPYQVFTHDLGGGRHNVVVYSPDNSTLDLNSTPLHLQMSGNSNSGLHISHIILTNKQFETVTLPDLPGEATNIGKTATSTATSDTYTLQGTKASTTTKGVVIRDGRKIVAK